MPEIWGLTGKIAAGKSSIAQLLSESGMGTLDADQISRDLTEHHPCIRQKLIQEFGTTDRALLRKIVFSDSSAKKKLEAILHPEIQAESKRRIEQLAKHHRVIVYEASLLIETGRHKELSGLIVVEAPAKIRLQRLLNRPGIDLKIAQAILESQENFEYDQVRKQLADFIIDNSQGLEHLKNQIQQMISIQNWS